jgi:hypothetical protein
MKSPITDHRFPNGLEAYSRPLCRFPLWFCDGWWCSCCSVRMTGLTTFCGSPRCHNMALQQLTGEVLLFSFRRREARVVVPPLLQAGFIQFPPRTAHNFVSLTAILWSAVSAFCSRCSTAMLLRLGTRELVAWRKISPFSAATSRASAPLLSARTHPSAAGSGFVSSRISCDPLKLTKRPLTQQTVRR